MSFVAALLLTAPSVAAQPVQQRDAARLLAPFSAICLDHIGDPQAQAAAAMAAPWNATKGETRNNDTLYELDGDIQVTVAATGDQACSVTGMLELAIDQDAVAAGLSAILPLGEGHRGENTIVWSIGSPEKQQRFGIGVLVSRKRSGNLGTLMVQNLR